MKTTMKKIISILLSFVTIMSISSVTAFATEYNRWTQAKYLTKDELFDSTWKSILSSSGTYEEKLTGNTLRLSYTYQELKKFVNDFKVPEDRDFEVQDMPGAFKDYMKEKFENVIIEPYSKKVVQYLKENPNADLTWTYETHGSDGYMEYICYDKSMQVDSYTSKDTKDYMQYSNNDISNLLLWTYDKNSDKYICKNENGKVVNSVIKYHIEGETSSSETTASTSSNSLTSSSQTSSMTDNKPDTASYSATTGSPKMESALTASGDDTPTTTESVGPDTQEVVFADDSSNPSTTQIILIVIGVLIIAGIIVIIIMLNKKKKEE